MSYSWTRKAMQQALLTPRIKHSILSEMRKEAVATYRDLLRDGAALQMFVMRT